MKLIRELILWIFASIIAFFVVNTFCFAYNRSLGWIDRDKAATLGIWYPNKYIVHGTEGYGIYKSDSRGYLNEEKPLDEDYILTIGSSYTQGKEVMQGQRFTDILNKKLVKTKGTLKVYNVSQDAYYFPDIANGFDAIIGEFPDAKKIIIEIGNTKFSNDILEKSMNYREYDENQNGSRILNSVSFKQKAKYFIKNYIPFLTNIKNQYNLYKGSAASSEQNIDLIEYEDNIKRIFEHFNDVYDREIIILFHPQIEINKDGKICILKNDTDEIFEKSCKEKNITFINMEDAFINMYNDKKQIPYGFMNTSLGVGHFNSNGHKVIAEELLLYLEKEEK